MIFLGHVGVTVCVVQAVNRLAHRRIDLRLVALISLVPDLIDKPLALVFSDFFDYRTRLYAHSALFSLLLLPLFLSLRRRLKGPLICWLAYAGHPLMDRMWQNDREMFLWPLLGPPPPQPHIAIELFARGGFHPWVWYSELVGVMFIVIFALKYRLYRKANVIALLKTGYLN